MPVTWTGLILLYLCQCVELVSYYFLPLCFELVSVWPLLNACVLYWSQPIIFFFLCLELVSSCSLLYACVLNWSHPIIFFMSVSWIGLILLSSLCLCFELVSSWPLLYACVLNWSHPDLFFISVSLIGLILRLLETETCGCVIHAFIYPFNLFTLVIKIVQGE